MLTDTDTDLDSKVQTESFTTTNSTNIQKFGDGGVGGGDDNDGGGGGGVNFQDLPNELLLRIFSYTSVNTRIRSLAQVCRKFRDCIHHQCAHQSTLALVVATPTTIRPYSVDQNGFRVLDSRLKLTEFLPSRQRLNVFKVAHRLTLPLITWLVALFPSVTHLRIIHHGVMGENEYRLLCETLESSRWSPQLVTLVIWLQTIGTMRHKRGEHLANLCQTVRRYWHRVVHYDDVRYQHCNDRLLSQSLTPAQLPALRNLALALGSTHGPIQWDIQLPILKQLEYFQLYGLNQCLAVSDVWRQLTHHAADGNTTLKWIRLHLSNSGSHHVEVNNPFNHHHLLPYHRNLLQNHFEQHHRHHHDMAVSPLSQSLAWKIVQLHFDDLDFLYRGFPRYVVHFRHLTTIYMHIRFPDLFSLRSFTEGLRYLHYLRTLVLDVCFLHDSLANGSGSGGGSNQHQRRFRRGRSARLIGNGDDDNNDNNGDDGVIVGLRGIRRGPRDGYALTPLTSIRVLHLSVLTITHYDLRLLHLPQMLPNLERATVLNYTPKVACHICSNETVEQREQCRRLMLKPLLSCAWLGKLSFTVEAFGEGLVGEALKQKLLETQKQSTKQSPITNTTTTSIDNDDDYFHYY